MTKLEELRHERERLERKVEVAEGGIEMLKKAVLGAEKELGQLVMDLNRARRLEREELQNAERKS